MRRLVLAGIIVVFSAAQACTRIAIRHQDHTHQRIAVSIDGKTSTLKYGGELKKRVSRGHHQVTAIPEGESRCVWTADGEGWTFWVDKEAVLTLLPPGQSSGEADIKGTDEPR